MEAKLAKMLLRYVQSEDGIFTKNQTIAAFIDLYGTKVGVISRNKVSITPAQKQVIRGLLSSDGIDPNTLPDAWDGITRAEALKLGNNEKFTHASVKRRRVAIKSLRPSAPLVLNGQPIHIPERCHVEIDYAEVDDFPLHDVIIVVENWESFNDIHVAASHPDLSFPGSNPLVVWRGDKDGTRSDAMLELLRKLKQPVAAFGDYDPAGLVIARSLPRLMQFVAPPLDVLANMLKKQGLTERYVKQIAGCYATLERYDIPCLIDVWNVIRLSGRGLPQEIFL